MRKGTLRRIATGFAVAAGLVAAMGPGATAAEGLPAILSGNAQSQALHISLTLPSAAQLEKTLQGVSGTTAVSIPDDVKAMLAEPVVIDQVVSLNSATVLRADETKPDQAKGFATAVTGKPSILEAYVSTACDKASCKDSKTLDHTTIPLEIGDDVDLGQIVIAGASSSTDGVTSSRNGTDLVDVKLNLGDLTGVGKPLALVGDAFDDLEDAINANLKPIVDARLADVNDLLEKNELKPVAELLGKVVSHIGPEMNELDGLRDADLVTMSVLPGIADVVPETREGTTGLLARSTSGVGNLDILEGWATIDAVSMKTSAFANGMVGDAQATSDVQVLGAELGGALGIDVSETDIKELLDPATLKKTLADLGEANPDLADAVTEMIAAVDILYTVAGIDVKLLDESTDEADDGTSASATAGTLELTIAPRIPKLSALTTTVPVSTAVVPRLAEDDYVDSGIILKVALPSGTSAVAVGDVLSCCDDIIRPPARTGVSTPWLAAMVLLGGAVVATRFALNK